jgi:hypothetical protein
LRLRFHCLPCYGDHVHSFVIVFLESPEEEPFLLRVSFKLSTRQFFFSCPKVLPEGMFDVLRLYCPFSCQDLIFFFLFFLPFSLWHQVSSRYKSQQEHQTTTPTTVFSSFLTASSSQTSSNPDSRETALFSVSCPSSPSSSQINHHYPPSSSFPVTVDRHLLFSHQRN